MLGGASHVRAAVCKPISEDGFLKTWAQRGAMVDRATLWSAEIALDCSARSEWMPMQAFEAAAGKHRTLRREQEALSKELDVLWR